MAATAATPRGPMFRHDPEPPLRLGQYVVMLDSQGARTENGAGVFEVTHIEAAPLLGSSGLLGLATAGAAFPAGYTASADKNATLNIATPAASESAKVQPLALQYRKYQLAQARFRTKFLNLPAPPAMRDLDVRAYSGSVPRWTSNGNAQAQGVLNYLGQVADYNDTFALSAQGANEAIPAAYPALNAWAAAARTELWWYSDQSPSFSIFNNGSAALGGTFAWFLEVMQFVYNLAPVTSTRTRTLTLAGHSIEVPQSISRDELLDGMVSTDYRAPSAHASTA